MGKPDRVKSEILNSSQVHQLLGDDVSLLEQARLITDINIQQAINCCGLTSVSYALSVLMGKNIPVDDLFLKVGVGVDSAVGDGMTLAEIHDAASRYIDIMQLPLFVECYHFDQSNSVDGFRNAAELEGASGIDDLFILNFHSGIAHGKDKGGGHFSVLAGVSKDDRVIMADVHGMKYGKFWATPVQQMFDAMADKDSVGRSRGALRFGKLSANLDRPIPGLLDTALDWASPPEPFSANQFRPFIPPWDELLGARNMEGVSAIAAALRAIGEMKGAINGAEFIRFGRIDEVMRTLSESYTWHLNNFINTKNVVNMLLKLQEAAKLKYAVNVIEIPDIDSNSLKDALEQAQVGVNGVVALVAYDVNLAQGVDAVPVPKGEAGALSHGLSTWSSVAAFDAASASDQRGVVLAAAHHVIVVGRLWRTSLNRLADAMKNIKWYSVEMRDGEPVNVPNLGDGSASIVVIDAR